MARRPRQRADRTHRRPRWADRPGYRGGALRRRPRAPWPPRRDLRREALRRATASWHRIGAHGGADAARARRRRASSGCRHQRAVLRHPRRLRGPRRPYLHRRRAAGRRGGAAPAHARALFQVARGDGGAVRRSSRRARFHGGDRAALRVPPQGALADPAPLLADGRGDRRNHGAAPPRRDRARPAPFGPWSRCWPRRGRVPRAARPRARRDRPHAIRRLLSHRRRFHRVGEGSRHSRGAGPRLGGGLARLLRAHHHRSRPHALRAPVRAIPQSRTRVDAGLRHRLLPVPARRGDPLRAGTLRARSGGADHHLRLAAGARRVARRGACAGDALRASGPPVQADPVQSGGTRDARQSHRRRGAAAGGGEARSAGEARLRHPTQARRALPPRLYRDPKSDMPVTQFNMKWVEQAGLVKFDFLGLKTLTVIEAAARLLARRGVQMDIQKIPLDDKKSYDLLSRGETVGVFQIESTGMRKALVDMRPDRFEDIIALVALYRPGPMANIPTYNMRKHGQERPDYIHPKLEPILKETFGVIIYQEQVMQIAQELAGFTLGQADLLRRAMGKKIRKEMAAQRDRFVSGAIGNGVERYRAEDIFELLAKFADYGFNKSHAAAYAMVAYQTAYLKANYPVEFLAASMTLDMGNTDKLAEFHRDADRQGIKVFPPSVNLSAREFEVHEGAIVYALAAIKGVGGQSVDAIVAARGDKPFVDLADFAMRVDPRAINKRTLECLTTAGAFDGLEPNRAAAFAAVDSMLAFAQRAGANKATGQSELFSGAGTRPTLQVPAVAAWLPSELLKGEDDAIGYFLSGHPLDDYAVALARLRVPKWAEFSRALRANMDPGKQLAATVVSRVERRTRTGVKIGIIGLSDPTGHFEAVLFQEGLAQYRDLLEPGTPVLLQVNAEMQGEDVRVRIFQAEHLDQAAAKTQRGLRVFVNSPEPIDFVAARLNGTHGNGKSEAAGEVSLVLVLPDRSEVEVKLPGRYAVTPAIAGAIKAVPGVVEVQAL